MSNDTLAMVRVSCLMHKLSEGVDLWLVEPCRRLDRPRNLPLQEVHREQHLDPHEQGIPSRHSQRLSLVPACDRKQSARESKPDTSQDIHDSVLARGAFPGPGKSDFARTKGKGIDGEDITQHLEGCTRI